MEEKLIRYLLPVGLTKPPFLEYDSSLVLISTFSCCEVKVTQLCPTLCDPMDYTVHGVLQARILEWVAFFLLQQIFPTQEWNQDLLHCRWLLHQLNYHGSPNLLIFAIWPGFPAS